MKIRIIIYFFISLLLGLFSYIFTNNILFLIFTFLLFFLSLLLYEFKFLKEELNIINKKKDMHEFIKNFSLSNDFDKSINNLSKNFNEECEILSKYEFKEKLEKISNYFNSQFFFLYIRSFNNNNEKMCNLLSRNNELIIDKNKKLIYLIKKHIFIFIFLYLISLLILFILRFALSNYINKLFTNYFYLIGIAVYFSFILFSLHILIINVKKGLNNYD